MNIEEWSGYEVSNEVLQQAASWITVLDNKETVNADVHSQFFTWLQATPEHQQAYFELSEMWAKSACTKSMFDMLETSTVIAFENQPEQTSAVPSSVPNRVEQSASPAWTYVMSIGLIFCGMLVPVVQAFI